MKTNFRLKGNTVSIAVIGCLIIAVILTIGTFGLGRHAGNDTKEAVRNVSNLYLSELAGRREQVVSSTLNDYIKNLDAAIGLMTPEDLLNKESLREYQLKIKQLYELEKFAFIDSEGLIYTSRGTRTDIDQYGIDYANLSEPQIMIRNLKSSDKKVVIAVPLDNMEFMGKSLVVCFMEIDMEKLLRNVSIQSNNNTTFCNIYTKDGVALTDMVLGGLASEDNLLDVMKLAQYEDGASFEQLERDFTQGISGVVSFSYNGIRESLYYVPVHGTDWMLTYLIRESVIGEQINSISESIIFRSLIQSVLTALILAGMFALIFVQQKQASKAALDREIAEAENRLKQQELEEQLAIQEELLDQEKKRAEQDNMISALAADYRGVYYVNLDTDLALCYRKEDDAHLPSGPGVHFPFLSTLTEYGNQYVAENYREEFFRFINPAAIRKALEKETVISCSYLIVTEEGERYESIKIAGVRHPEDRVDHIVHAIGVGFVDIDEQMRDSLARREELSDALKAAREANRAKSGFVSNMSHEIRTPITAILGMNEMIRRESKDEHILSYADNINNAGESLLGIISDILDFSKIEAGRMELIKVNYSLPGLLSDLYNLIRFRTEAKGLDFKIRVDKTLPSGLVGDELRVKQIISNLLTNAVKYTEKGSVTLHVQRAEGDDGNDQVSLSVSVSDTGIGIKKEEMDKLFSPFDRLDVKRTRSIEGSGLGLSITWELLQMMDSELMVESTYNVGSRFYFTIRQGISDSVPVGEFDPTARDLCSKKPVTERKFFTAPGKKILLVDDMQMNLQVLTGLLKRSRMLVETALNGEEAIAKFGISDFDIVLLDYRMPMLDGIDTLKKLHELYPEKAAVVPIIALTASSTSGDRENLLAAGFTDFLSKPVNIPDLEETLSKYLGSGEGENTPDKDVPAGKPEVMPEPEEPQEDPSDILKGLANIPGLSVEDGLTYCAEADDYIFALRTYADSVDKNADRMEQSLRDEKLDDFTLVAHSLKSMSRSIGANGLFEKAKNLEAAGKNGDISMLRDNTPAFLSEYRELCGILDKRVPEDPA